MHAIYLFLSKNCIDLKFSSFFYFTSYMSCLHMFAYVAHVLTGVTAEQAGLDAALPADVLVELHQLA